MKIVATADIRSTGHFGASCATAERASDLALVQTKALNPVMDLPTISVFISLVPS
jgi:hypothetical protein